MTTPISLRRRLLDATTLALVCGLSLLLLIYIGYGEAKRICEQFYLEKLVAQNRVVQSTVERFLRPGLPLKQYVGFSTGAARILASDDTIAAMAVFDEDGQMVFSSGNAAIGLLPDIETQGVAADPEAEVRRSEAYVQVVLPLSNRYERVGSLAITMPRSALSDRLRASFEPLVVPVVGLSLLFAGFVSAAGPWLTRQRIPRLQIVYALIFVGASIAVVGTLVSLYAEGAQAKTKALADSLGQRFTPIFQFQLDVNQIVGLEQAFADYRRLNPDISAAALTVDGEVVIHTDPSVIGERWLSRSDAYEYIVDITPPGSLQTIHTAVAVPADVVYRQVARSVKNFAALFVASAFLASLFLQLAGSVQRLNPGHGLPRHSRAAHPGDEHALRLVKPVFYIAMCVEHLSYSFLPQFTHEAVARAGLSPGYASAIFIAYYLCFALTLVPAGHYAQRLGQRPLMAGGLALTAVGFAVLMLPLGIVGLTLGRALAGIGQGMLFIGVQSYILAVASPGRKTQGASIIVFGFQGGMISGMAIGSLLVTYIGPQGVFNIGAVAALAMAVYATIVVPRTTEAQIAGQSLREDLGQLGRGIRQTLCSPALLRTIGLIGVPAKAVLTGVIVFALPLLMAQAGYAQEDIGQVLMIYAAGVVLASGYASRLVDRTGRSGVMLFFGAVVSGVGLAMIALTGWLPVSGDVPSASILETVLLVAGIAIVGLAHGLINAPVVTHVAELDVAHRIGASSAAATYRFLERVGHVAGPIIVGQLFLFGGQEATVLGWIAGAVTVFGILFIWPELKREHTQEPVDAPRTERHRDVVGLYIGPPDLALMLAAESTAAPGCDATFLARRSDSLRRRAAIRRRPEGTPGSSAGDGEALVTRDGTPDRRRVEEFAKFLAAVDQVMPADLDLHLVLGRQSTYELPVTQDWLVAHPRCRVQIEPDANAWYTRVRLWLLRLTGTPTGGAQPPGARQLASAITAHFQAGGGDGGAFVWIRPRPEGRPEPSARVPQTARLLDTAAGHARRMAGAA